jgi:hypothetical protein
MIFLGTFTWIRKQSKDIKRLEKQNKIKDLYIDMMSTEQSHEVIMSKLGVMSDDVLIIKRGMYGDPTNGYIGLIERQKEDEKRLDTIEQKTIPAIQAEILKDKGFFKKIGIVGVSGFFTLQTLYHFRDEVAKLFTGK